MSHPARLEIVCLGHFSDEKTKAQRALLFQAAREGLGFRPGVLDGRASSSLVFDQFRAGGDGRALAPACVSPLGGCRGPRFSRKQ